MSSCPTCGKPFSCQHCMAAAGGRATRGHSTRAKRRASRANGALGGRPKLPPHSPILHKMAGDRGPRYQKADVGGRPGCVARAAALTARMARRQARTNGGKP